MPRRSTAGRSEYEAARAARRRADPEYKAARRQRFRERYANDSEWRQQYRAYQDAYRKRSGVDDNTRRMRIVRGMVWTPEEEAAHYRLTHCQVCGGEPTRRGLFADHCHNCRHYRGGLCQRCNADEGVLRKWQAVCPVGSPMRAYLDRHTCGEVASPE
jgi:hypothetical protein